MKMRVLCFLINPLSSLISLKPAKKEQREILMVVQSVTKKDCFYQSIIISIVVLVRDYEIF